MFAPSAGRSAIVRIVLDTNIVVSGLLWRGALYELMGAIRAAGDVDLYSSPALL